MNAYGIIASWTADRAAVLRDGAAKAQAAYTKDPMRTACLEYAGALRTAANMLDEHHRAFLARAATQSNSTDGDTK